jgi:hypothetical protein
VRFFRRRYELAPANIAAEWSTSDDWRDWDAPRNLIRGESNYLPALRKLCGGGPRDSGYLIPVDVDLVRDPGNPYDRNAWRAEVGNHVVGYLAREVAAQLSPPADAAGCRGFRVCGLIRGGSSDTPFVGVHVWLDRRLTTGVEITFADEVGEVNWPPGPAEGVQCSADEDTR